MSKELGDIRVGQIVKLKEDGTPVDYLVVHHGVPSSAYDPSCDGSWILRKDLLINHPYADDRGQPYFANSRALEWLNSQMYNQIDPSVRTKILQVKIPYRADGAPPTTKKGAEGLQCRIFFLSIPEFGYDYAHHGDGTRLAYFESGNTPSANAKRAAQVNGKNEDYYTRSPDYRNEPIGYISYVSESGYFGTTDSTAPDDGQYYGSRPAMILPHNIIIDDSDVITGQLNYIPDAPASITVPDNIKGGESIVINWTTANDANGNLTGYQLERRWDNTGSWDQVYKGNNTSYQDAIPLGQHTSVAYRVRAYDECDKYSGYATSPNRTIINNSSPKISGSDSDLGSLEMTPPEAYKYTVDDADAGDTITVTEAVDGKTKRTFTATRGKEYSLSWTVDEWMQVLNGNHTATIKASDGEGGTATRTLTFSKSVTRIEFYLDPPLETDTMPTKALENVVRSIPAGATFRIELCNNGFDVAPTWEDVTAKVISGDKIFLRNTTKTAAKWGYGIHVIVERNGASGECWVSSGAGFFE